MIIQLNVHQPHEWAIIAFGADGVLHHILAYIINRVRSDDDIDVFIDRIFCPN